MFEKTRNCNAPEVNKKCSNLYYTCLNLNDFEQVLYNILNSFHKKDFCVIFNPLLEMVFLKNPKND